MTGLAWLHLSDWHQKGSEFDRQVVFSALLKDIRDRTKINPELEKINFVVFSGDVAFSGKPEEYQAAKEQFFQPILNELGLKPKQLFIVPGNHDLDRDEFRLLPRELTKPLVSERDVQKWLTDDRGRSRLLEPFQAFASFVREYTGQEPPDYVNVRRIKIGKKEIALLGLNSAWICGRNNAKIGDKGFVIVGEPQIHGILEGISDADLKIVVLHHPFDWLTEFDCNRIETRIMQGCDFILRGHQHKPKVEIASGTSGDCVIIPAGASYNRRISENPLYANSCNYVHLDFDTGKGIVFLRRWSDPRNKWVEDIDSCDGGKCEFNVPKFKSEVASTENAPQLNKIIPHQIPPPPADFKGREDEIKDILANFEKGATITGLRGMGGIGKTALALVLAERLKDQFPDGQIFIDMRGTSVNLELPPVTPVEAMAQIIRAYNPVDRLPENPVELRGLYLSILTSKRTLLLMDNAANSEQVEPLLPPVGCSVLITSRIKFALPGLVEKDLNLLPIDKARELLLEIAPRIGSRAEELAKLCGYLPIALRNAGKALAEKKDLGVSEYEKRLRDKVARLELVRASFSLSYELLTPGRKKQWRRLSVFPEDFDRYAATAVLKMSPSPASEALSDLVKWSLVDFIPFSNSEDGRYKLHELARIFAESCLEASELLDAQQKHARHYQKVLSEADKLYEKGEENLFAGLKLFDREWANIKVGQAWTKNMVRISRKLTKSDMRLVMKMADSYANDGAYVLDLRLHPRDKISWLETGLTAARMMGDRSSEGAHLGNLGSVYSNLGEIPKAIEYYGQALVISRKIGDRRGEGADLCNLGLAYSNLGETRKAIEYYEQALAIAREIGSRRSEAADLCNLGSVYFNMGEAHKAIEYYGQALAIAREIGDRQSEGADLGCLGNAYSNLGEIRKAIEYYEPALAISRKIGDKRNEGNWLGNLGSVYSNLGKTRKAIEYYEQALAIAREIGYRRGEGANLGNLGLAYSNLGETRKAIEFYEQALAIGREIEDRMSEGETLCNLGKAYSDLNEADKAVEHCMQSLDIVRKIEYRKVEGEALCNLGKVYADLGENYKAINHCDQALEIFQKMEYCWGEGDALFYKSLAMEKLGQRLKAIESAKAALTIFEQIESPHSEKVRQKLAEWQIPDEPEN
jgi:tetratricopeptide (TPR) repeat protein/predicted phosphodiesterase